MADSMLDAALTARARGWSVLPMRPRAKAPQVPWRKYQESPADEARIRSWFERWPDANVGFVTGKVSGLVVIDIDPRHGGDASLEALEAEHEALPETIESRTGGGGRHLYFRHPGGVVPNRVGVRDGVDVRGDGGCIVLPPSVHPSGRRYRWVKSRSPDDLEAADMPRWLVELLGKR